MKRVLLLGLILGLAAIFGIQAGYTQSEVYIQKEDDSMNCTMMEAGFAWCIFPHCWDVDIEYDPNTVQLTSVDLHDPDDPKGPNGRVWQTFNGGMINDNVRTAAENAMRNSLQNRHYEQPCIEPDCDCNKQNPPPGFGAWQQTSISQGFSIPSPTGNPARLYYTAHGTVNARGRANVGPCKKVPIEM